MALTPADHRSRRVLRGLVGEADGEADVTVLEPTLASAATPEAPAMFEMVRRERGRQVFG